MVAGCMPTDTAFADIEAGTRKVTDDWFLLTLGSTSSSPYFEQLDGHRLGAPPADVRRGRAAMLATGSFHISAVRLGAKFLINLIAPITVTKDKAKYEGIYNATFILGVNTAGKEQGHRRQVAAVPLRPVNAAVYASTGRRST